jgi:hypothetical protein
MRRVDPNVEVEHSDLCSIDRGENHQGVGRRPFARHIPSRPSVQLPRHEALWQTGENVTPRDARLHGTQSREKLIKGAAEYKPRNVPYVEPKSRCLSVNGSKF